MQPFNALLSQALRRLGGEPCFRIYGKARAEPNWRVLDVFATSRRDLSSRLPLWGGTCTTWSDRVIAVGWDFAALVLAEQRIRPASREFPLEVSGGRLRNADRVVPTASEILAHECGHTYQAIQLGALYLPVVGSVTLFREGPHWWNHFENRASAEGQFGGLVNGSVNASLLQRPRH